MRIEIDTHPATDNSKAFFGIRLYPETNEDMNKMEWGAACGFVPVAVQRNSYFEGTPFHYIVRFEQK